MLNNYLQEQIKYLLERLHRKEIDSHQLMKLLDMVYKDYLDFNPEEKAKLYGSSADTSDKAAR